MPAPERYALETPGRNGATFARKADALAAGWEVREPYTITDLRTARVIVHEPRPITGLGDLSKGARRTACPECAGKGWEHFTSDTYGRQVEACDSCTDALGSAAEERAIQLHRIDCECDWPENGEDEAIQESDFYEGRTMMPVATFEDVAETEEI